MYQKALNLPRPIKELLLGVGLGILVIVNGFRNGGKSTSIRYATRNLWNEFLTEHSARRATHQFAILQNKHSLKLHLGCGSDIKSGWVNIDSFISPSATHQGGETIVIQYDLRQPLYLAPESCQYIYSSHFFEHLYGEDGFRLMQECYKFLEPNGVFRIALPDLKATFKAYIEQDEKYFDVLRQRLLHSIVSPYSQEVTLVDYVNFGVYQHNEHKIIYDVEKLTKLLTQIGFRSIKETAFKPEIDPDDELRVAYSFYVEAIK